MGYDYAGQSRMVIEWLSRHGPATWHGVAQEWNWDHGEEPLLWIAAQPDCDRATAAHIFWLTEPDYWLARQSTYEGALYDADEERLVNGIMCLWNAGFYRTGRFAFGGEASTPGRREWVRRFPAIPASLAEPVAGTESYPHFAGLSYKVQLAWQQRVGEPLSDYFADSYGRNVGPIEPIDSLDDIAPDAMVVRRPGDFF